MPRLTWNDVSWWLMVLTVTPLLLFGPPVLIVGLGGWLLNGHLPHGGEWCFAGAFAPCWWLLLAGSKPRRS